MKDKYDTIKNRRPLEVKLIKIKIGKLKLIKPLTIVKTLYGSGVNPAKNNITNQGAKTNHIYLKKLLNLIL